MMRSSAGLGPGSAAAHGSATEDGELEPGWLRRTIADAEATIATWPKGLQEQTPAARQRRAMELQAAGPAIARLQGLLDELALVRLRATEATSPTARRNAERATANYHKAIGRLVAEHPAIAALASELLSRRAPPPTPAEAG